VHIQSYSKRNTQFHHKNHNNCLNELKQKLSIDEMPIEAVVLHNHWRAIGHFAVGYKAI